MNFQRACAELNTNRIFYAMAVLAYNLMAAADTALRLARYEKQKQIERDVEPLDELQPATA